MKTITLNNRDKPKNALIIFDYAEQRTRLAVGRNKKTGEYLTDNGDRIPAINTDPTKHPPVDLSQLLLSDLEDLKKIAIADPDEANSLFKLLEMPQKVQLWAALPQEAKTALRAAAERTDELNKQVEKRQGAIAA